MNDGVEAAEIKIVPLSKYVWGWVYVAILPMKDNRIRLYIRIINWWRLCLPEGAA